MNPFENTNLVPMTQEQFENTYNVLSNLVNTYPTNRIYYDAFHSFTTDSMNLRITNPNNNSTVSSNGGNSAKKNLNVIIYHFLKKDDPNSYFSVFYILNKFNKFTSGNVDYKPNLKNIRINTINKQLEWDVNCKMTFEEFYIANKEAILTQKNAQMVKVGFNEILYAENPNFK